MIFFLILFFQNFHPAIKSSKIEAVHKITSTLDYNYSRFSQFWMHALGKKIAFKTCTYCSLHFQKNLGTFKFSVTYKSSSRSIEFVDTRQKGETTRGRRWREW